MLNFERSSLNQKLTIMSLMSAATALLVVFAAFAVTSVLNHRSDEGMQLSSFAGVIGTNSVDALQFNDRALARNTLAALRAKVEISRAILYDRHGQPFASYRAGQAPAKVAVADTSDSTPAEAAPVHGKPKVKARERSSGGAQHKAPDTSGNIGATATTPVVDGVPLASVDAAALSAANLRGRQFWSTRMRLYQPIENGAGQVGVLMIEADLSAMWIDIVNSIGIFFVAMAVSLLVSLVLAARFKRSIAQPVNQLIMAAQQVSSSQDYSLRLPHQRTDELGRLIDSFNTMLAQIEDRGAALTHHRDELEFQVGVRTAQFEKAKNAAEAASRAKSAFLATMSHEIRTPMNGVLGMTEMLLGTQLTETQRDFTRLVKRSGEHLLVIINDILDFSKIEAGKLSVEYINFNLWDLLDDIHTVYTPQAKAKHIALDFDIANDIPVAICGDPNRLRQIIANLLGNAIKFTDAGQILATVRVASENAQAVDLRFEVHDTGIGVASDARTRIFEAFSQADDSTTRKYGGTGLGLAISKQLVELMGGQIGVDSGMKQGSVFWFTASFDKSRLAHNTSPGDGADGPAAVAQADLAGLRVLVVDEQAASRAVLEQQLAGWQVSASCALSALDGIERLRVAACQQLPFDAAIIDMELTRTSGLALAAAIKADPAIRATRLLLISPNQMAADPVQRRAAGVAYQLTKPARSADLYACLATRARGATVPAAAPALVPAPATPARVSTVHPATLSHPAASHAGRTMPAAPLRVLLAEDNPVNVEVAKAMLGSLGLDVHCARHGADALAALREHHFDAVLMDCQMPVMDGFAATAAIRRFERDGGGARSHRPDPRASRANGRQAGSAAGPALPAHVPIIAITANALQGDREACLAAGMDDYLSKPFSQQQLHAVLGRWVVLRALGQRDAPAQCNVPTPAPPPPPAAINKRALDAIRALNSERGNALVHKVVSAWVDDTPLCLVALRQAIAELDALGVRKVAHSLKSSSANVGADSFARLCRQLEQLGRDDTTEGASGILNDMEQEFQSVRHSLSAILEKET
jgi:signal transduction histidine kinase/DNA-binding response OmpR family regulator/HPt (histidine-containing phosphotransfer) domain-containing protein